jgi:hypothetical protein
LSPILFLFYTSELLEIYNQPKEGLSAIGFADNVNLLAYSHSTETNCWVLEEAHTKLLKWASQHRMRFAPKKYELVYFSHSRKGKFNLKARIQLGETEKEPTQDVHILDVQVDSKLQWSAHRKKIEEKATAQIEAFVQTTSSTWGASLPQARQVYSAVVRPALVYGAAIWHTPAKDPRKAKAKGLAAKLQPIQNKCLQVVTGAYRATPTQTLETEAYVPPIDLYLDSRLAAFRIGLQTLE